MNNGGGHTRDLDAQKPSRPPGTHEEPRKPPSLLPAPLTETARALLPKTSEPLIRRARETLAPDKWDILSNPSSLVFNKFRDRIIGGASVVLEGNIRAPDKRNQLTVLRTRSSFWLMSGSPVEILYDRYPGLIDVKLGKSCTLQSLEKVEEKLYILSLNWKEMTRFNAVCSLNRPNHQDVKNGPGSISTPDMNPETILSFLQSKISEVPDDDILSCIPPGLSLTALSRDIRFAYPMVDGNDLAHIVIVAGAEESFCRLYINEDAPPVEGMKGSIRFRYGADECLLYKE